MYFGLELTNQSQKSMNFLHPDFFILVCKKIELASD